MQVYTNSTCLDEKQYIFHQIFHVFLGIDFIVHIEENRKDVKIIEEGKEFILKSDFFQQFDRKKWLSLDTLPKLPLSLIEKDTTFCTKELPVLFGNTEILVSEDSIKLGLDIFGSCFFMLSRYEELVIQDKDEHGRFPAKTSIAYQGGFLSMPIVDEYVGLLWNCIHHLWPLLQRNKSKPKTYVSCDVDHVKDKAARFPGIIKRLGADLLVRKSINDFWMSLQAFYKVSILGNGKADPFNTFDFMMDECEKNNLKMAFYFIPRNNKRRIDGDYDIESHEILELMEKIIKRGHEVGYHASYDSYKDRFRTLEEVTLLKLTYKRAGGNPKDIKGGRQHYLRWETGTTEKNWEAANLTYDSTLGYAESIGFRCGTSREYSFYDCINRSPLNLKIRPLIVMEVSALHKSYMALNHRKAFSEITEICKEIKDKKGNFTLLWHNSSLRSNKEKELFSNILSQN